MKVFLKVVAVSFGVPLAAALLVSLVLLLLTALGFHGDWSTSDPTCTGIICW